MGSQERSRKKIHIWKKAILHFSLCFVMGFFTGFAPTSKTGISSGHVTISLSTKHSPQPVEVFHQLRTQNSNRSLLSGSDAEAHNHRDKRAKETKESEASTAEKLVIVVTPTSRRQMFRNVMLRRLANTLRLVAQPLLWVVVEPEPEPKSHHGSEVSEILRRTGIMYRHVVYEENLSDADSEMDHQRNLALKHIEHHRLSGIVLFAGLSTTYDLTFFQEIRAIEAFGAWPIAKLSANKKRVMIEGPVCDSSEVVGWHFTKMKNSTADTPPPPPPPIHVSSFAFNTSILWDPERWGRTFSTRDAMQNSLKYVKEEVLEEATKLKGIPAHGCSKVLLWDLHIRKGR